MKDALLLFSPLPLPLYSYSVALSTSNFNFCVAGLANSLNLLLTRGTVCLFAKQALPSEIAAASSLADLVSASLFLSQLWAFLWFPFRCCISYHTSSAWLFFHYHSSWMLLLAAYCVGKPNWLSASLRLICTSYFPKLWFYWMSDCDIPSHVAGWTWLQFCCWYCFLGPCCCSCFRSLWTASSSAFPLGLYSRLLSLVQTSLGLNIQATIEFWVMDKKERSLFVHSAKARQRWLNDCFIMLFLMSMTSQWLI